MECKVHLKDEIHEFRSRPRNSYVWGDTVWKAKTQAESLDYLFELAVKMVQLDLDPAGPIAPIER